MATRIDLPRSHALREVVMPMEPSMKFTPTKLTTDGPVQPSARSAAEADHRWSGCDGHNATRHYRGYFDRGRAGSKVTVHLTWRESKQGAAVDVGAFAFDLGEMLDAGLIREERDGDRLALRIVHERGTDRLVIRLNDAAPALLLGTLR